MIIRLLPDLLYVRTLLAPRKNCNVRWGVAIKLSVLPAFSAIQTLHIWCWQFMHDTYKRVTLVKSWSVGAPCSVVDTLLKLNKPINVPSGLAKSSEVASHFSLFDTENRSPSTWTVWRKKSLDLASSACCHLFRSLQNSLDGVKLGSKEAYDMHVRSSSSVRRWRSSSKRELCEVKKDLDGGLWTKMEHT